MGPTQTIGKKTQTGSQTWTSQTPATSATSAASVRPDEEETFDDKSPTKKPVASHAAPVAGNEGPVNALNDCFSQQDDQ